MSMADKPIQPICPRDATPLEAKRRTTRRGLPIYYCRSCRTTFTEGSIQRLDYGPNGGILSTVAGIFKWLRSG